MNFPSSGLLGQVQTVLGTTAAKTNANIANPNALPKENQYLVVGSNGVQSTSLAAAGYGAQQGNNSNPVGRMGSVIPREMCNIYKTIFDQVNYVYRI